MPRHIRHQRHAKKQIYLNDGFWQNVGNAFTDPEQRFEFPIKPMQYEMTKENQNTLLLTAGILAGGLIAMAVILKSK